MSALSINILFELTVVTLSIVISNSLFIFEVEVNDD
jgi:hypothetical protein